jgi:hypothetical protein
MQRLIGEALYYAKSTLRVSPYFQVLALLQSFALLTFRVQLYLNHYNYKLLLKLIKQEVQ